VKDSQACFWQESVPFYFKCPVSCLDSSTEYILGLFAVRREEFIQRRAPACFTDAKSVLRQNHLSVLRCGEYIGHKRAGGFSPLETNKNTASAEGCIKD